MEYVKFINIEFFFAKIADGLGSVGDFFVRIVNRWFGGGPIVGTNINQTEVVNLFESSAGTGSAGWPFVVQIILILVSVILLAAIVYTIVRIIEAREKEKVEFANYFVDPEKPNVVNPRWEEIVAMYDSPNEADWRLAIMESNNMLEDLLKALGYQGDTVADRLKAVEPSDFPTLPFAWEAHVIRNKVAHEGMTFPLSRRESRRVMKLYETVFTDARYI